MPTRHPPLNKYLKPSVWLMWGLFTLPLLVSAQPQVPEPYRQYIVHYVDRRGFPERILNGVGLSGQAVGRSFALIAGVSKYPQMTDRHADLTPAAWDLANLTSYLQSHEFFDEIVVLAEEAVTVDNLSFFLTRYFPQRLEAFPKSRFLFAYSGHGMTNNNRGYLLTHQASHLRDRLHMIPLGVVRSMFQEVIDTGHHVLALINSCYSGSFLRRSFGSKRYYRPKHPGAHAITAGGTGELTWHDANIGKGSIFFEKFFTGLDGRADILPRQPDGTYGDGIVTVDELMAYLRQEVAVSTEQEQNPQAGDLSRHGSQGGLFFLDHLRQVESGVLPRWKRPTRLAFGGVRRASSSVTVMASAIKPFSIWKNSIGMTFVRLPAGSFIMGSPESARYAEADEHPAHRVTISQAFDLGQYEVTQAQWQQIMGNNPSRFKGDPRRPVEYVSWEDVQQFINKLNAREKRSGWIYRLPTEAEWEYAARAKSETAYHFGDDVSQLSNYAWYLDNANKTTHPVGQKQPNTWQLYDMHGNVWEYVQDWYAEDYYQRSPPRDPQGPTSGGYRVQRGGSWQDNGEFVHSAYRSQDRPGSPFDGTGFRLARGQVSSR